MSHFCFSFVDIEDLPPNVQEKLFDEVLDRDVQKGDVTFFFTFILYFKPENNGQHIKTMSSSTRFTSGQWML